MYHKSIEKLGFFVYAIAMERTIFYKGQPYHYYWVDKDIERMRLKIDEDGLFYVLCPDGVPFTEMDSFVLENMEWCLQTRERILKRTAKLFKDYHDGVFYYFGTPLTIKLEPSKRNRIAFDERYLYVSFKREEDINKTILAFVRDRCKEEIPPIVQQYYECLKQEYPIPYPSLLYRKMKNTWGQCRMMKATITFNTRLLHFPKEFMEYVVLHELAHLVISYHTDAFYRIIEKVMPDYKEREELPYL